ncbi:MAG: hypothetical protein Q9219_001904 [cf. Caloplaca sp. 3 TL-2023]
MTTVAEVQALLRFLSQDAKIPVPLAIPETLSKTPLPRIQSIFPDEKQAKQILSAAKRTSKKRTSTSISSPSKRLKPPAPKPGDDPLSPAELEASLSLPTLDASNPTLLESEIQNTIVYTNRAPLVVAFVVQLLKHTMPSQPLSSRLSLAQAVMSTGARFKALNLGIEKGKTAEDEGWGEGQPKVRVMGREVPVMRRWGYEWQDRHHRPGGHAFASVKREPGAEEGEKVQGARAAESPSFTPARTPADSDDESQDTIKNDPSSPPPPSSTTPNSPTPTEPPLWALNLDALRSTSTTTTNNLPIHFPHAARAYLLKSFASSSASNPPISSTTKSEKEKETKTKEHNLALLFHALDLLFASWLPVIGAEEMDRRAWGWYVRVRPDVEDGVRGWGGRGEVRLEGLLRLRR